MKSGKQNIQEQFKSWIDNWDILSVFFKFSAEIRKIMYTTNAIESLNSTYKKELTEIGMYFQLICHYLKYCIYLL